MPGISDNSVLLDLRRMLENVIAGTSSLTTTGGSGGGTSLTQADVQAAIDASADINSILALLGGLPTSRLTQAEVKAAIETATTIDGIEASLTSILAGLLTQSQITTAIQNATNIDGVEGLLSSILAGLITQSQVQAAIDASTDIDTVLTRLQSIISGLLTQSQVTTAIQNATNLASVSSLLTTIRNDGQWRADVLTPASSTYSVSSNYDTWTVPATEEWQVQGFYCQFTTNATAGNRYLELGIAKSTWLARSQSPLAHAASTTYYYQFGAYGMTTTAPTLPASQVVYVTAPNIVVPPSGTIQAIIQGRVAGDATSGQSLSIMKRTIA